MADILPSLALLAINLGLLWLLMAAPFGTRTIRLRRRLRADPLRIWNAVYPKGDTATWNPSVLSSETLGGKTDLVRRSYSQPDRKGRPITRVYEILQTTREAGRLVYDARIVEDSALDPRFWRHFSERRQVATIRDGAELTIEQTDSYRGIAFFAFRYFALRREMRDLESWLDTGKASGSGLFEHPLTQLGLAVLSTLLLWPFFGLHANGLIISSMLTVVIVLHEFGHMAAYRAFGHERVRMIFVPLLGGLAIGGRPYNSLFEVATCALMGAGMSAFLVPVVIALHDAAAVGSLPPVATNLSLVFLLILGAFNLLNLLPMNRFDGGQVLRQVFRGRIWQMTASMALTGVILWIGWRIGVPATALMAALAVFTLMSLIGSAAPRPREALPAMSAPERLLVGFGLFAAISIHGYAVIYACDRLFG